MIIVEAQKIKHYIEDKLLLDIAKIEIYEGDRIGLIGANGSGKTTLLHIIAAQSKAEEGNVKHYQTVHLIPQLKEAEANKSGGEITQKYVQEAISVGASLLIADEPTTHLDTGHVEWLEKSLRHWQGALLIVSHDRTFLDTLCTKIWELHNGTITVYSGNYSDYVEQKEVQRQHQQMEYEKYIAKKKQLEEALVEKVKRAQKVANPKKDKVEVGIYKPFYNKKSKKMEQTAKAIATRIEKLEKVDKVQEQQPIKMDLPAADTIKNQIILRAEQIEGKIEDRLLWDSTSFYFRGGDKVAITGANGSGKTTLINMILQRVDGIRISPAVKIGYFSQNLNVLDTNKTILENVQSTSKQNETFIRIVLSRLKFFKDDVHKKIDVLSGGERVKVALAKLFVSDVNTLLLDEPTNFLDIDAVQALEELLIDYEGTIIFVSHDRKFIKQIATRNIIIENQKIQMVELEGYNARVDNKQSTNESINANDKKSPSTVLNNKKELDDQTEKLMLIDLKLSEVLSKLSIEPNVELELQYQNLLIEKRAIKK